jgi:serine protease Do
MDEPTPISPDVEHAGTPSMLRSSDAADRRGAGSSPAVDGLTVSAGRRRFMLLIVCLAVAIAAPSLIGKVVYKIRFNELKAGADVAMDSLAGLKPRLSDLGLASRMVAKRLEPSVVSIFRPGGLGREGQGSGVIVDQAGFILTNYHVVSGARSIEVQLSDGRRVQASVVGADDLTDLAVLKIELPDLIAAEWGDSDELEVGDLVWAVGSPFGFDRSITFGIVSAKARRRGSLYQEYLQTDAAVNPGNSGGPLVNIKGEVVGINAAIVGPAYQGVSFAIPSNLAHEEYTQLQSKGWIERAYLGIRPQAVPQSIQQALGLTLGQGVYVGHVEDDAPADKAGIQRGDVILEWNDVKATDPYLLSQAIAATKIGSTAQVRVLRGISEVDGDHLTPSELKLDVQVERHPWSVPVVQDGR